MRYFNGWLVALVIIFFSTGCEAPLQMDAVEQGLNTPVRRSDQFQMASANDSTIVVVGNQALVLTSTDQGGTWRRSQLTGWPELIDVTSCPNGYFAALAAEGEVWVSQDDGNEWVSHVIDSEEAPQAITCDSRDRIWVVGSFSSIFSSEDAGASWDFTSLDEDTILTNIQFVDEQTAYISGEFGTLLRTTDGGETWERLPDLEDNFYPQAMYFEDTSMGWVVGLQGQILHTEDRGESWVMQQSGTLAPLFGIEAIGGELYAVGGEGTVLRQRGKQWSSVDHGKPVSGYLRALLPVGADRLLVAGQAGALHVLPLGGS